MSDDLQLLRGSLAPAYANADPAQLRAIVQSIYGPGATPEDVEGLFDDIGKGLKFAAKGVGGFAQKAAPMLGKALPSIATGAASGAAFGPWGALVGGLAGGASGILQQTKNPTARAIGGAIHSAGSLVSTVRGGGAAGNLGALGSIATGALGAGKGGAAGVLGRGGGGASNALLGLLSRPETLQALLAGTMGGFGKTSVPVGGRQVPVSQMLSALGVLGARAAGEAAELHEDSGESLPGFMSEAGEALGLDTDDVEGRTDTLLTVLALSPAIWGQRPPAAPVNVTVAAPEPTLKEPALEAYESDEWDEWDEDVEDVEDTEDTEDLEYDEDTEDNEALEQLLAEDTEWDESDEGDESDEWNESDEVEWDEREAVDA